MGLLENYPLILSFTPASSMFSTFRLFYGGLAQNFDYMNNFFVVISQTNKNNLLKSCDNNITMKSLYLVLFGQYTKHDQQTSVCFPPQHKAFASNVWKIFSGRVRSMSTIRIILYSMFLSARIPITAINHCSSNCNCFKCNCNKKMTNNKNNVQQRNSYHFTISSTLVTCVILKLTVRDLVVQQKKKKKKE